MGEERREVVQGGGGGGAEGGGGRMLLHVFRKAPLASVLTFASRCGWRLLSGR